MKSFKKLALLGVLAIGLMSSSFALLKVEGAYTAYPNSISGTGVGVDFPLIPFFPTSVFYHTLSDATISLGNFTIGGKSFSAGDLTFKQSAIEIQIGLPIEIPLMGIAVGASAMANFGLVDE